VIELDENSSDSHEKIYQDSSQEAEEIIRKMLGK
jgi:hypothetical protein